MIRRTGHGLRPVVAGSAALLAAAGSSALAQQTPANLQDAVRLAPLEYVGGMQPVMDNSIFAHVLLDQFEDRAAGNGQQFRYDGQGWIGTDTDKLWVKSEGTVGTHGQFIDGDHELLYDRAISTYFDLQGGVRMDLDSGPTRTWAALGVQGLSLYFFDLEATGYVSDRGRTAARLYASYDLLITNRLVLQPQAEMNLYSKVDPGRGVGSGLSDIDAGLRLRYEFTRKLAPYVGVTYTGYFGQAQRFARADGERVQDIRFTFGLRSWF
ncbi:copper resistance protein B [Lichenicoccus roseus]|uniref:Copper resistance protein B n=1 Tax=Lichenicoccus roseus TaxID=2683649 RepID=A0A5R9J6Z1_9PROT|nr:copper resistance protein B [Lichenicoccus roseus]TLU71116.1 copper resistance protein B [Lichenicoccus roseus]